MKDEEIKKLAKHILQNQIVIMEALEKIANRVGTGAVIETSLVQAIQETRWLITIEV